MAEIIVFPPKARPVPLFTVMRSGGGYDMVGLTVAVSDESLTHLDLWPTQARDLAALLVRYANCIEDGQGELDLGEA
jgi:hypothetical protein